MKGYRNSKNIQTPFLLSLLFIPMLISTIFIQRVLTMKIYGIEFVFPYSFVEPGKNILVVKKNSKMDYPLKNSLLYFSNLDKKDIIFSKNHIINKELIKEFKNSLKKMVEEKNSKVVFHLVLNDSCKYEELFKLIDISKMRSVRYIYNRNNFWAFYQFEYWPPVVPYLSI